MNIYQCWFDFWIRYQWPCQKSARWSFRE